LDVHREPAIKRIKRSPDLGSPANADLGSPSLLELFSKNVSRACAQGSKLCRPGDLCQGSSQPGTRSIPPTPVHSHQMPTSGLARQGGAALPRQPSRPTRSAGTCFGRGLSKYFGRPQGVNSIFSSFYV